MNIDIVLFINNNISIEQFSLDKSRHHEHQEHSRWIDQLPFTRGKNRKRISSYEYQNLSNVFS